MKVSSFVLAFAFCFLVCPGAFLVVPCFCGFLLFVPFCARSTCDMYMGEIWDYFCFFRVGLGSRGFSDREEGSGMDKKVREVLAR